MNLASTQNMQWLPVYDLQSYTPNPAVTYEVAFVDMNTMTLLPQQNLLGMAPQYVSFPQPMCAPQVLPPQPTPPTFHQMQPPSPSLQLQSNLNTPRFAPQTHFAPQNCMKPQTHFAPQPQVTPQFHPQPLPQLEIPQFPVANVPNFEAPNFSDSSSLMAIEPRSTIEISGSEEEYASDDAISSDSSDFHFGLDDSASYGDKKLFKVCTHYIVNKDDVVSICEDFGQELSEALNNVFGFTGRNRINFAVSPCPQVDNGIQWCVPKALFSKEMRKKVSEEEYFDNQLKCELAKIGEACEFNKHLTGAKQLTIINEGRRSIQVLDSLLHSTKGRKERVLNTREEDKFEEENKSDVLEVSLDEQGKALRGPHVAGLRFKLLQDIFKMTDFLAEVKKYGIISRATMIASLKTQKQYKGWSVYLDVGCEENYRLVEGIAENFGFKKTKVFVAHDTPRKDSQTEL